jgi:hypothetical protein
MDQEGSNQIVDQVYEVVDMIRDWVQDLSEMQAVMLAILLGVVGLTILQLSFDVQHVREQGPTLEPPTPLHVVTAADPVEAFETAVEGEEQAP